MSAPRHRRPLLLTLPVALLALVAVGCGSDGGSGASADRPDDGALRVVDVTIDRPATPGTAVVRLSVRNGLGSADALVGVSSPVATSAELHRTDVDAAGRSSMVAVASVPIAARATVTFQPGGLHVMLRGIARELAVGDEVPITFTFREAGRRTATAEVVAPGSNLDEDHAHDD
jgi:copper(I)-binding protein